MVALGFALYRCVRHKRRLLAWAVARVLRLLFAALRTCFPSLIALFATFAHCQHHPGTDGAFLAAFPDRPCAGATAPAMTAALFFLVLAIALRLLLALSEASVHALSSDLLAQSLSLAAVSRALADALIPLVAVILDSPANLPIKAPRPAGCASPPHLPPATKASEPFA